MSVYEILGILSPVVASIGYIPYIQGLIKGKNRPHPFSWLPWSIIGLITLITYTGVGATDTLPLAILNFIGPTLVVLLSLKYFKSVQSRFDYTCLYTSLSAIVIYVIFHDATVALTINLLGDLVAHLPTIRQVYLDPYSENMYTWIFFALGNSLSILAIRQWSYGVAVFPVFLTIAAFIVVMFIAVGRLKND